MVCETEVTMDPVTEECKTMFILNSGKNEVYSSQQMSYEQANVRFTCSRQ